MKKEKNFNSEEEKKKLIENYISLCKSEAYYILERKDAQELIADKLSKTVSDMRSFFLKEPEQEREKFEQVRIFLSVLKSLEVENIVCLLLFEILEEYYPKKTKEIDKLIPEKKTVEDVFDSFRKEVPRAIRKRKKLISNEIENSFSIDEIFKKEFTFSKQEESWLTINFVKNWIEKLTFFETTKEFLDFIKEEWKKFEGEVSLRRVEFSFCCSHLEKIILLLQKEKNFHFLRGNKKEQKKFLKEFKLLSEKLFNAAKLEYALESEQRLCKEFTNEKHLVFLNKDCEKLFKQPDFFYPFTERLRLLDESKSKKLTKEEENNLNSFAFLLLGEKEKIKPDEKQFLLNELNLFLFVPDFFKIETEKRLKKSGISNQELNYIFQWQHELSLPSKKLIFDKNDFLLLFGKEFNSFLKKYELNFSFLINKPEVPLIESIQSEEKEKITNFFLEKVNKNKRRKFFEELLFIIKKWEEKKQLAEVLWKEQEKRLRGETSEHKKQILKK